MNIHIHIPWLVFWILGGVVVGMIIMAVIMHIVAMNAIGRIFGWRL